MRKDGCAYGTHRDHGEIWRWTCKCGCLSAELCRLVPLRVLDAPRELCCPDWHGGLSELASGCPLQSRPEDFTLDCPTCCSAAQSCQTLCDPMDQGSTPGFPVLHHLLELAQTHVH